ncbi:MAG: response regulator [Rhodobacteraceae bacterium]|nr:response regulator [Paracoccaceae bacterium]
MAGGGRHVLVIEDEPNIVEAIRFILDRDGWRVSAHGRGGDAIEVIRAAAPDVLILDVMLPGRSGYEILRELRADDATAALPVLMLTARGQSRDRAQAERAGTSHFIAKPFANSDVLAALRALVGEG